MHLLHPITLGIVILLLLAALVSVKQLATSSILEKPTGGPLLQAVNIFNILFLLVVNPIAAVGLITGALPALDPTHFAVNAAWLLVAMEFVGLALYVVGFGLMAWALLVLGRNYQLGGSAPRAKDKLITGGPYGLIRHPMYTAALGIALGLGLVTQSAVFLVVFFIYLVLILELIPIEERELQKAYSSGYLEYRRKTRALVPAVY